MRPHYWISASKEIVLFIYLLFLYDKVSVFHKEGLFSNSHPTNGSVVGLLTLDKPINDMVNIYNKSNLA